MNNRTGYRTGLLAGILILLAGAAVRGQLSPGELSEPHTHLKGLSNCTKCHTRGAGVANDKCLDCHVEIQTRISENRGYHVSSEVAGKECIACHSDHHGRDFRMIRLDTSLFDHGLTGYDLHGAHAGINCISCHQIAHITDPEIRTKSSTFLGLDQKCITCHTDYHQGTLSGDCTSCHDFNRFRPAQKFSHAGTGFPLLGSHSRTACSGCHYTKVMNGKEMQVFRGIKAESCTDCHEDFHEGRFGKNCTECHTYETFRIPKNNNRFNHALTEFPLVGKHSQVACTDCHKSGYRAELAYSRCTDCHPDFHRGDFTSGGKQQDCEDCHTTLGFELTTYSVDRHIEAPFGLTGAHLAVPCFSCHRKDAEWSFREIGRQCGDCHENIHEPYMDPAYVENNSCTGCHQDTRWSEISFDHITTGYLLEGSHRDQACRACHFPAGAGGQKSQKFSVLSQDCTDCHRDTHRGQFANAGGTTCLKCHDYFNWGPGHFDHSLTRFPLVGKHSDVACNQCHPVVADGSGEFRLYRLTSTECASCH